jgi:hypothetical protein
VSGDLSLLDSVELFLGASQLSSDLFKGGTSPDASSHSDFVASISVPDVAPRWPSAHGLQQAREVVHGRRARRTAPAQREHHTGQPTVFCSAGSAGSAWSGVGGTGSTMTRTPADARSEREGRLLAVCSNVVARSGSARYGIGLMGCSWDGERGPTGT